MEEILISFVIPAYNAEKTITTAVQSIGTDQRVEILIAENGSTDHTNEVLSKIEKEYEGVFVLHTEKGVSRARNNAIKMARGRYLFFLDADDRLEKNAMPVLLRDAREGCADLYLYSYMVGEEKKELSKCLDIFEGDEAVMNFRKNALKDPTRFMQVWSKLFRTETMRSHQIVFNEKIAYSEDSDFFLRFSGKCKSIMILPETVYHYELSHDSVMRKGTGNKAEQYLFAMKETGRFVKEEKQEIQDAFLYYVLTHLNIVMVRDVYASNNDMSFIRKMKRMKKLINCQVFKEAIAQCSWKKCRSLRYLPALFLKWKMYFCASAFFEARVLQNRIKER